MQQITVIIPTRDTPLHLLRRAVASVRQGGVAEIIVVDDGSERALTQEAVSPRATIVTHPTGKGLYRARLTGIRNARSAYCLFLDADDYLAPHAVERVLATASSTGADIVQMAVCNRLTRFNLPIARNRRRYDAARFKEATLGNAEAFPVQAWGKLYATEFLKSCSFPDYEAFWGEDRVFNATVACRQPKVAVNLKAVYNYCWHHSPTKKSAAADISEYAACYTARLALPGAEACAEQLRRELATLIVDEIERRSAAGVLDISGLKAELAREPWNSLGLPSVEEIAEKGKMSLSRRLKAMLRRFL